MKKYLLAAAVALTAIGCGQTNRTLGEHVDDGWIATKVRTHLMTQEFGPQMNVNIDVVRGVVTLKGEAHDEATKMKVEELVRQVVGVREIDNQMTIVSEDMQPSTDEGRRWQERTAPRTSY